MELFSNQRRLREVYAVSNLRRNNICFIYAAEKLTGIPRTKPLFALPDKGSQFRNHVLNLGDPPHHHRKQLPTFDDDDPPSPLQTQIPRLSISPPSISSSLHLPRQICPSSRRPVTRKVFPLRLRKGSRTSTRNGTILFQSPRPREVRPQNESTSR